jgi:tetratricopeptide (TPR) repeat protein
MLGDRLGAIEDFDQAIKIYPDYAEAYKNRGTIKASLGQKQQALSDFQKAASLYKQENNLEEYVQVLKLM